MRAEEVYVDPSALTRLYLHQEGSREMAVWRRRIGGTLALTHHGRMETTNAICRAAFTGMLSDQELQETLADFDSDFVSGHLQQVDILWRSALKRAGDLSRLYTPKIGTRSLDILHVACALELKARYFLTFDTQQKQLAAAEGLRLVRL